MSLYVDVRRRCCTDSCILIPASEQSFWTRREKKIFCQKQSEKMGVQPVLLMQPQEKPSPRPLSNSVRWMNQCASIVCGKISCMIDDSENIKETCEKMKSFCLRMVLRHPCLSERSGGRHRQRNYQPQQLVKFHPCDYSAASQERRCSISACVRIEETCYWPRSKLCHLNTRRREQQRQSTRACALSEREPLRPVEQPDLQNQGVRTTRLSSSQQNLT